MKIVLIVLLAVPCARCQFQLFNFFPMLANTAREISAGLTRQPNVQRASDNAGTMISSSISSLSNVPLSLSRAIGVIDLPQPSANDINIVDAGIKLTSGFNAGSSNQDADLTISQLLIKYGRQVEEHQVLTEDGYVLTMFRIPGNGTAVFLMHGLLGSADDFVIAGPDDSLAYLLSDAGYDIWIGNARGNKHSRKHIKMNPRQAVFWDFSWHEIGYYDLPAMIDYTLYRTGQEKLKYIGHSQGTVTFWVMASSRPEYNAKIAVMIALSPVAYISHTKSPVIRLMATGSPIFPFLQRALGLHEFLPENNLLKFLSQLTCGLGELSGVLCSNAGFLLFGFSSEQLNTKFFPVMFAHGTAGASTKQFLHFAQEVVSGHFRRYDYGAANNLKVYGSQEPPDYPLEKITAPVSLFYSEEDWMAHPLDVDKLYNRLSNCVDIYKVPRKHFNHMDFLFAKEFKPLVYNRITKLLKHFKPRTLSALMSS